MKKHPGRPVRLPSAGRLTLCVLGLAIASDGPVLAQSYRIDALTERVERLEGVLPALRQGAPTGAGRAAAAGTPFAASVEIRLSELEVLIRRLEQRIESLEIAERRAKSRLERMAADTEHRLRGLAQGGTSPAAAPGTAAPPDATIIGGTTAPDAAPRPLGTLRLSGSDAPPATAEPPSAAATAASILPQGGPKERYDYALSLILQEQEFAEAEKAFAAFIEQHPRHDLTGNAYFWLGQTRFVREDYQNAAFAFAEGFQKFPRSGKAPDNLYKLGTSLARLGKTREACIAFRQLLETFPQALQTRKPGILRERKRLKCR